jgi:hypothetical protein
VVASEEVAAEATAAGAHPTVVVVEVHTTAPRAEAAIVEVTVQGEDPRIVRTEYARPSVTSFRLRTSPSLS